MHVPKQPQPKEVLPEIVDEGKKTEQERDRLAKRRGRTSNILVSDYRATPGKSLLGE